MKKLSYFTLILFAVISCNNSGDKTENTIPKTLKGTTWTSEFYFYNNFYSFETDSTGYSEDGQMARSCPIDTLEFGITGNHIIYFDPREFIYSISNSILTLEYINWDNKGDTFELKFYHRQKYNDWISTYEYVYGREGLRQGSKKEIRDL